MERAKPTSYSPAIGDQIVERMSEGATLLAICAGDDVPSRGTIYRWAEQHAEFREKLERARHAQAHFYFESMIRVAFDESQDIFIDQDPTTGASKAMINHAKIQRDRLKCDTLKFASSKLLPRTYGERPAVEDDSPKEIRISWMKSDAPAEPPPVHREPPRQLPPPVKRTPPVMDDDSWKQLVNGLAKGVRPRAPGPAELYDVMRQALLRHYGRE